MRALWVKAPFVLRRHPAILAAVVATSAIVALVAASSPFVRAGVRSESLRGQVRLLSPFAVGLEIRSGGPARSDGRRRDSAVRLGRTLPAVGTPVATSMFSAQVPGIPGNGLELVAMARTNALAHVGRVASTGRQGVWISSRTAQVTGLRPGGTLRLGRGVRLRVAGVYRALDGDLDNPYWANFVQDIRALHPDAPLPPAFVLMPESTLVRAARLLGAEVENRFEYPVDPASVTFTEAERLSRTFGLIGRRLVTPRDEAARKLGCAARRCAVHSALTAALAIAATNVAAVSPTISLLAGCGLVIALALAFASGIFLVRRRADEVEALDARGESPLAFAARVALEALVPAAIGAAIGFGLALETLRIAAAKGTIDAGTVADGAERVIAAATVALLATAGGAAVAFPRRSTSVTGRLRRARRLPWELVPLAAAAVVVVVLLAGGGLARDANGNSHPSFAVFVLPLLAAAGAGGLAVRALRRLLSRPVRAASPSVFLAVRRLAGARSLLVAVLVSGAIAFGAFAYTITLSRSLGRSVAEKAFVANGSDIQGYVDPLATVPKGLAFPVALVQVDSLDVSLPDGRPIDVVAGDPRALARTILWGDGWPRDPRPLLGRLRDASGTVPAIATPDAPTTAAIVDQGARIPLRIVGRAAVPGASARRPALLVPAAALAKAARRAGVTSPGPGATGLVWARGSPALIQPALASSSLSPFYVTTTRHLLENPSVAAARRSYRFVTIIAAVAGVLALVTLLLYLQARQRAQRIATALARRMGLGRVADAGALALEAGAVAAVAAVVGGLVAVLAAAPLIHRVDPLPLYAPTPEPVIPWLTLLGSSLVATAAGMLVGAAAAALAARADVAEALRVA